MSPLVGLAFGAGLLAPLNPCGIALLPAYLATFLDPATNQTGRLRRAAGAGIAVTSGFIATTMVIGVGLAAGLRVLVAVVPWLAAILGVLLAVLGVMMLVSGRMPLRLPDLRLRASSRAGWWRLAGFGAGYALASVSCTLAVLLAVVTQALAAGTVATLVGVFAAYAVGSGLLLLAVAVAGAAASTALCGGTATTSVTGLTVPVTDWITTHPTTVAVVAGALLAVAVLTALTHRWATRHRNTPTEAAEQGDACKCPPPGGEPDTGQNTAPSSSERARI